MREALRRVQAKTTNLEELNSQRRPVPRAKYCMKHSSAAFEDERATRQVIPRHVNGCLLEGPCVYLARRSDDVAAMCASKFSKTATSRQSRELSFAQ